MRFFVKTVVECSGRVGHISELDRLGSRVLETPLLLMYTKGGSVPHITHEVLQMITEEPLGIQVPISTVMETKEALSEFGMGLGNFIGFKDHLTYCTVQDPATPTRQGFSERDMVAIFSRAGKRQIDADRYMDLMEVFQPDMYQSLCDGNTDINSSKKRIQKSAQRTSQFFKKCVERHKNSKILKNSALLGMVEGGYSIAARETCAKEMAESLVSGFVIDGLHCNGPEVEQLPNEKVTGLVESVLRHLPEDKFRVIHGCWNPDAVLDLVELGIDIFDSSYPYLVTERGSALVFTQCIFEGDNQNAAASLSSETGHKIPVELFDAYRNHEVHHPYNVDAKYEINLKDRKYFADFRPLCDSCSCLTCRNHTRAYIHHLLNTRELLGSVLLMMHNLHYYMEFFKNIRGALKENSWTEFRQNFVKKKSAT